MSSSISRQWQERGSSAAFVTASADKRRCLQRHVPKLSMPAVAGLEGQLFQLMSPALRAQGQLQACSVPTLHLLWTWRLVSTTHSRCEQQHRPTNPSPRDSPVHRAELNHPCLPAHLSCSSAQVTVLLVHAAQMRPSQPLPAKPMHTWPTAFPATPRGAARCPASASCLSASASSSLDCNLTLHVSVCLISAEQDHPGPASVPCSSA